MICNIVKRDNGFIMMREIIDYKYFEVKNININKSLNIESYCGGIIGCQYKCKRVKGGNSNVSNN